MAGGCCSPQTFQSLLISQRDRPRASENDVSPRKDSRSCKACHQDQFLQSCAFQLRQPNLCWLIAVTAAAAAAVGAVVVMVVAVAFSFSAAQGKSRAESVPHHEQKSTPACPSTPMGNSTFKIACLWPEHLVMSSHQKLHSPTACRAMISP